MKKFFWLMICANLLIIAFVFSSCTIAHRTTGGTDDIPTIKWYNTGPQVREMELVLAELNKYTIPKIGTRVECINMTGAEIAQKMGLIMASNEVFDMCFTAYYQNFYVNVMKNSFLPLDDLLKTNGQDILAMLPEGYFKSATVNGEIYAVPAFKDNAIQFTIGYNKSFVRELGFDVDSVQTIYDIEPALESFKAKYPNNYPLMYMANYTFYPMLGYIDVADTIGAVSIYEDSGRVFNPYETEESMEYFKKMHQWYKKGYIRPDAATAGNNNGVAPGIFEASQQLPYQRDTSNSLLPENERFGDIRITKPWMTGTAGSMVAISRTSKNPEKTMDFINLLNTDKYVRNLMAYGIEGRHYIAVGENHFRYPEGVAKRDDNSYFSYPYTQGNMFLTLTMEGTPDDIWDKYREFDESAIKSQTFGFAFDGSALKSEISALNNVKAEYITSLTTGTVDPEVYLPQALEKMKDAGIDKVLAEMQLQLDKWREQSR